MKFIHKVIQINLNSFIHSFIRILWSTWHASYMQYMYLHMGECQMGQCKVIQVKFTTEIMQSHWNKIEGHSNEIYN